MAFDGRDDSATWLLDQPPTPRQRRTAYIVIFTLLVAFAATAPFHQKILFRSDGFIPTVEALMFLTDFITSILLFSQFSIYGSRALLVLASGYLFTALIIIPHLLSFPGTYAPGGLFGANLDTTGWLYYSWHLGLPLTLLTYAWLKKEKSERRVAEISTTSAIVWSVLLVIGLVFLIAWLATRHLPYDY